MVDGPHPDRRYLSALCPGSPRHDSRSATGTGSSSTRPATVPTRRRATTPGGTRTASEPAKVAATRAHTAALRPCRDLRNRTAEQPGNRGLKRFQYPVVVRGSSQVEIEANDSKVLEVLTPESEHWRGLQLDPNHRLLIRRSLVRAQVGEPTKSKGYVANRHPFLFAILESDLGYPISSTSPRSYRQISGCLSNVGFAAVRPRLRRALATRRSHQHL